MSGPCILYTFSVHRSDSDNQRWKYAELPDDSFFATLDEVRAEVADLRENNDGAFPDGVPPLQIERIETLPLTPESLLLLLNKGMESFIIDYKVIEVVN